MGNIINIFGKSSRSTLKIIITKEYRIKCCLLDLLNRETIIQLNGYQEEYYQMELCFDANKISLSQNGNNSIPFIQDLIENPNDFKVYNIVFQEKEYNIIGEVLFALLVNEFKKQIEKDFIIDKVIIELPRQNKIANSRILTALDSIGLTNIDLDEEEVEYDYSIQEKLLTELLERNEMYNKRERMIEKGNIMLRQQKKKEIEIDKKKLIDEQEFNNELIRQFTTKERTQLKLCQLNNYCIFIASRFLNSIDDHINLTKVCKKLKYNMDKFHYNPISINNKTIKLFPYIETFHTYEENDQYLISQRIIQYVDWRKLRLCQIEEIKKQNSGKVIEFKHILFTKEDVKE